MAASLYSFERLNIGIEATKGTLVAATRQLVGNHNMVEEQDFYHSNYPVATRTNVGGTGAILRKGTAIETTTELTAEEILWAFELGLKGGISPTTVDTTAKLWTYTPEITTGVPTIKTATVEMVHSDGVTNHYYGEAGHAMCSSFKMDWAFNQVATLSMKFFARARQTGTVTASLVPYPSREILVANQLGIFVDTTYGGLGGTALSGLVRSASLETMTGFDPDYVLDGRADVDFGQYKVGRVTSKLSIVMEFDATAATQYAKFRANSALYIRLRDSGSLIGSVNALRYVQVDNCYRFVDAPSFSEDGEQKLATFNLESFNVAAEPPVYSAQNTLTTIA